MMALRVVGVLAGLSCVLCQGQNNLPFLPKPPAPGPCPLVPVVNNFDLQRYLGRWYEIERFFNPFQNGECVTADYELFPNGTVSVINTQISEGELDSISGFAELGPNQSEGKLVVDFPFSEGSFSPDGVPNYIVVATDYSNYAVVHSCTYLGPELKLEFSWILAREPNVPASFLMALKEWLKIVNIDASRYLPTLQTPYCPRRQV
ncbi:apolipoprotein D-like [Homarus americanus]|uniref:Apolipoprotein D n=1 Tax=Homarus americanus TaxID=6706 RepID=A0A8J5KEE9_HOMAM|nr:apolipoprotein D-like [Homarus americanus]KAG7170771.1 Apolipoprotein D-like 12 [Homarus americanus]